MKGPCILTRAVRLTTGLRMDAIIGLGLSSGVGARVCLEVDFDSIGAEDGKGISCVWAGTVAGIDLGRGPNDARYDRLSLNDGLARNIERMKS